MTKPESISIALGILSVILGGLSIFIAYKIPKDANKTKYAEIISATKLISNDFKLTKYTINQAITLLSDNGLIDFCDVKLVSEIITSWDYHEYENIINLLGNVQAEICNISSKWKSKISNILISIEVFNGLKKFNTIDLKNLFLQLEEKTNVIASLFDTYAKLFSSITLFNDIVNFGDKKLIDNISQRSKNLELQLMIQIVSIIINGQEIVLAIEEYEDVAKE